MDPENIMLSEIGQTEKDKHCISLICQNLKNNTVGAGEGWIGNLGLANANYYI